MKIIAVDDERIALEALEEAIKEAQQEAEILCFRCMVLPCTGPGNRWIGIGWNGY